MLLALLFALPVSAMQKQREADALLQEKRYEEADRAFREAWHSNPTDLRGLTGQVEVRMATGRSDEAVRMLQAEVDRDAARLELRMVLGNTAVRAGQYDLAIAVFQALLPQVDSNPRAASDLYLRLGETFRRKRDLDAATVNLQRSLELGPGNPIVLSTLAVVLDGSGRKAEAERAYRAVLEVDRDDAVVLNNLAFLLSENGGDLDEALTLAQRAQQLLPTLNGISDTLGWIYLKKNDAGIAIRIFEELVRKQPADPNFHYHLGVALLQKGDKSAASAEWRRP